MPAEHLRQIVWDKAHIRVPREVNDAVEVAAPAMFTTKTAYFSRAVLRQLEDDGVELKTERAA